MAEFENRFKYNAGATPREKANLLMRLDSFFWNSLNLSSGSELEAKPEAQKAYLRLWRQAAKRLHITSVGEKTALILEDNNYHSANEALAIIGLSPPKWHPKTWNRFPHAGGKWVRLSSGWWAYRHS